MSLEQLVLAAIACALAFVAFCALGSYLLIRLVLATLGRVGERKGWK